MKFESESKICMNTPPQDTIKITRIFRTIWQDRRGPAFQRRSPAPPAGGPAPESIFRNLTALPPFVFPLNTPGIAVLLAPRLAGADCKIAASRAALEVSRRDAAVGVCAMLRVRANVPHAARLAGRLFCFFLEYRLVASRRRRFGNRCFSPDQSLPTFAT